MTIGSKVALSVILFGGIGTLIFIKVRQAKAAAPATPPAKDSTSANAPTPATGTPGTPVAPAAVVPPPPAPPDPRVGKTASAKFAGVVVFNKDFSPYKTTAAAGEWIGTISSVSGGKVWVEGDSRWVWDTANGGQLTTNFSGFAGIRVRRKRFNEQV